MFRRQSYRDLRGYGVRTPGCLVLVAACAGCSSTAQEAGGLAPSRQRLASSLGTNELSGCDETLQPDWPFPGAQRNIRLLRLQSRNVLVYDLVGRGSTQTIWQPLAEDYSFLGDGRAVGKPGRAQTLDFDLQESTSGHVWTSYRYRYPNSSQVAAQIEWLPQEEPPNSPAPSTTKAADSRKSRLTSIALPSPTTEAVQNIWLLPHATNRPWEADVVTKVYRFSKQGLTSAWQESEAATFYYWYRIDGRAGKATLAGSFKDTKKSIEAAQFLMAGPSSSPFAVTIERDVSATGTAQNAMTRVKLRHLFEASDRPTEIFAAAHAILANLDAKKSSLRTGTNPTSVQEILTVAWSLSSEDFAGIRIQWLELPLQPQVLTKSPAAVNQSPETTQGGLPERRQGFAVSSYPPVALNIRHVEPGNADQGTSTFLTWMTATSSETAFLALPIRDAATPQRQPQTNQMATERIPARAHVLQREALIYAGTAFFPHDAQAMLLFRDPYNGSAVNKGQGRPALDVARLPVQICAVALSKKGTKAEVQESTTGSAHQ